MGVGLRLADADRADAADAAEVDDVLAALAFDRRLAHVAERPQQLAVEREAALQIGDDEVEMVDRVDAADLMRDRTHRRSDRLCEHVFVRWDNLTIEQDESARLPGHRDPATIRRFDAPEALDMRFYEIHAKSAINRVPDASKMPFRWTINPYRGCSHACITASPGRRTSTSTSTPAATSNARSS